MNNGRVWNFRGMKEWQNLQENTRRERPIEWENGRAVWKCIRILIVKTRKKQCGNSSEHCEYWRVV